MATRCDITQPKRGVAARRKTVAGRCQNQKNCERLRSFTYIEQIEPSNLWGRLDLSHSHTHPSVLAIARAPTPPIRLDPPRCGLDQRGAVHRKQAADDRVSQQSRPRGSRLRLAIDDTSRPGARPRSPSSRPRRRASLENRHQVERYPRPSSCRGWQGQERQNRD